MGNKEMDRFKAGALAVVACAALLITSHIITNLGSAQATAVFGTTRANAGSQYSAVHAYNHYTVKAVVVIRDSDRNVVSRKTYDSRAKAMAVAKDSGTGSGPGGCFGNTKVTITKFGRSLLGFKLYSDSVFINWGYDCLAHDVNVLNHGRNWTVFDGVWQWDGWAGGGSGYFTWINPYGHSGFNKKATGEFHGPCINTSTVCHEYPMAHLKAHSNGSNWWETQGG